MKKTTLVHRGREMEIQTKEGFKNGQATLIGRAEWTKNNYQEFATFYIRTVGNDHAQVIEFDYDKDLTKTMKKELAAKLGKMFI